MLNNPSSQRPSSTSTFDLEALYHEENAEVRTISLFTRLWSRLRNLFAMIKMRVRVRKFSREARIVESVNAKSRTGYSPPIDYLSHYILLLSLLIIVWLGALFAIMAWYQFDSK